MVDSFVQRALAQPPWSIPPTKKQWNALMWGLRDLILQYDLGQFVRPPVEYGASPYWGGHTSKILDDFFDQPAATRFKFGVQLPSTDEILKTAVAIPTSFALAERHGTHELDLKAFVQESPNSLLARTIAHCGLTA